MGIFMQENLQDVDDYKSVPTYYQLVYKLKNQVTQLQSNRNELIAKQKKFAQETERRKSIFKASISNWHTGLLGNTFQAWKKYTGLQKRQINKVQLLFSRSWEKEDRERYYFQRWRTFLDKKQREQLFDDVEKNNISA